MAKASGSSRVVKGTSESRLSMYKIYLRELAQNDVDESLSYFSKKGGGYVIGMKGRRRDNEELEAAKAMANGGLVVTLTPEGGVRFRAGKNKKTNAYVYADGIVNGYTYEQQTKKPQKLTENNLRNAVDNAL